MQEGVIHEDAARRAAVAPQSLMISRGVDLAVRADL
jgi:hypothetical protein